ncbi:DNA methyltransferase [Tetragenococcus halophilus]|uniref:DNA methyltransferase n=1 Tax=Tetragenococcus halophilus TaxID=51669 RepID=UPI0030F015F4
MTENKGKYDERNQLNDLTGKEWLKLTKSFLISEKCAEDKKAFEHPAPFLIKDVEKMISMFTKKGMTVLDPFAGSGTSMLACVNLNRKSINIDLSEKYKELAYNRLVLKGKNFSSSNKYIVGNSLTKMDSLDEVDYVITSPPYHNILKNKGNGIRNQNNKEHRTGSRLGVEYYSELSDDLGNQETYSDFLLLLKKIMSKAYAILKNKKYCSLVISDFTVNKKEVNVQGDIVQLMEKIGFEFVGTIVLLQDNKPLYPFGYPYAFKINHMHQNIINFRKVEKNE